MLKLYPERAVEILEQIILVQSFTADLMAQRPDFYLLPFAPPSVFLSFRSLRSLSFICIKRHGGEKDMNKPNGNTE